MGFEDRILIKRLNAIDVSNNFEVMSNLLETSYGISFKNKKIDKKYFEDKISSLRDYLKKEQAVVFGAFNAELLGFIWAYPCLFLNEKRIHINHFVVDKSIRGLGVGRKLTKEIENYALDNEIVVIELMVTSNSNSVGFYEKNDFKVERYQMVKRL